MGRLTTRHKDGKAHILPENRIGKVDYSAVRATIEKLAHYEDLEEQGRLIEQKHGTWNYINGGIINPHFRCSICYAPRFERYAANGFNFCPACGAKMVSEVKLKELEDGTV